MNCLLNGRNTIALFLSVFTALAWLPPAHAAPPPQYSLNCSDCHGNNASDIRPIDSNVTFRNVTTGAFAGNHQTHMTATTDKNVCVKCHGAGVSAYVTGHMDGQVQANANINNSPATGQYASTRAAFPNWSSNQTPLGTCSNVNCHFETVTPAWGSASFAYPADCNQCHGVAPATGSHGTHTTYFSGVTQCKKCHADHTASANKFAHATSAGKRNLIVQLSDPADTAGGSYSGAVNDFLPSQANVFGDCTNLYCHSQGKSDSAFGGANAPKSTATWGGALAADCAGCHGGTEASADDIATNKHAEHINQATAVGRKIGCQECHNATTTNGSDIASTTNHVNKGVNIKFTGINGSSATYDGNATNAAGGFAKPPGAALDTGCATLYCHSDGNQASLTYRTPTWNGAAIGCDGCHGDQAGKSYPVHGNAGAGLTGSNSHNKHAGSYSIGCVKCHSGTTSDGTTVIDGGAHLNGTSDVAGTDVKFDAVNPSGAYTAASQTCATTYCHSDSLGGAPLQTAIWGDTMAANCLGCHKGNAASGNIMSTNAHGSHVNNATKVGRNIGCTECHKATVTNDTTIGTATNHVDKNVNIKFDNSLNLNIDAPTYNGSATTGANGAAKTANTAVATCANVYCHSNGNVNGGARAALVTYTSVHWNGGTKGCDSCHGDQAGKTHPSYASGAAASTTANSHVKHVETSGISCNYCHEGTTTDTAIPPTTVVNGGTHLNRVENVSMKSIRGETPSYAVDTATCSTTYCHGAGTPVWGDTIACGACHGADNSGGLSGATADPKSGHALHYASGSAPAAITSANAHTATAYVYSCQNCHPSDQHATGPTDGTGPVFQDATIGGTKLTSGNYTQGGSSTTDARSFNYTNGTCSTLCHTRDGATLGSAVGGNPAWNDTKTSPNCGVCHNKAGDAGPTWSAPHTKHINTYSANANLTCNACHSGTASDNSTINGAAGRNQHPNQTKNVAFNAFADGTWSGTQCQNTYCHSNGISTAAPSHALISWSGNTTCTSCHGGNAGSGSPMATNKHASHINNATAVGKNIGCAECHAATASNDTTIGTVANHVEKNVNIKFDNSVNLNSDSPTYDGAASTGASGAAKAAGGALGAGCANVYCHSSGNTLGGATPTFRTIAWNAAAIGCDGCHGDQAGKAHPAYVNGGTGTATANSHVKHVETSGLSCDYCHVGTTTDTAIPPTTVVNGGAHLNRTENVGFKSIGGKTGTFNGDRTCSTTYCHGTGPSPAWGGATNCDSCHDADNSGDLSGATADPKSGHALHYNSASRPSAITDADAHTATTYVFSCQSCHPSNQHAAGPADASGPVLQDAAIGGTRLTSGNYTQAGASATDARGFNYTNGTCSTVCHTSDGATLGSAIGGNPTWSGTKTSPNCGVCHNKAGDAGPTWSAPHTKHINTYSANANLTCNACHSGTASDNSTINGAAGRNQHPNQTRNVAFNAFAGGTWSGTQCQNTYCHSNGTSTAAPSHALISWSGNTTCMSCHGGTAAGPGYGNGTPKANSHAKHVVSMGYGCNACHNATTTDGTTITTISNHVNKAYNVAAGGGNTFTLDNTPNPTTAAQCSNISCHGGSNATWGGSAPTCKDCHGGTSDTDNFGATFWSDGTRSQLKLAGEWDTTGHGRPTASGNYPKSANPAANFTGVNECAYCHDAGINHRTAANLFRLTNYSTQAYGRNAPCLVCHGRAAAGYLGKSVAQTRISSAHYGSKHTGTPGGGYFCWDCHDPHGDGNIYMVHDSVAVTSERSTGKPLTTAAVSFIDNATGTDYAKSSGPFNGICNVCHTSTGHYTASSGDSHNDSVRCTDCHNHIGDTARSAFKQSGNCDSCHGYPPVRRDLVAGTDFRKQNQYSSGRFQDYTGGGGAHTIAKHVDPGVKASDGWAPCAVCHSDGINDTGRHTMATPVKPDSSITIDVKDSKKFDYRRSLGQERYTGAKFTNDKATNMTGSCSNVSCHFKPSKRWSNSR